MGITVNGQYMSHSRLDKIMKAGTLEDAQRLSLFESIKSFFRFGVDPEVIKEAFMALRQPLLDKNVDTGDLSAHEAILENYYTVWDAFLPPDGKRLCRMEVNVDERAGTWSYAVRVGGMKQVECKDLPIGDGAALTRFQDYNLMKDVTEALSARQYDDPLGIGKTIKKGLEDLVSARTGDPVCDWIAKAGVIATAIPSDERNIEPVVFSMGTSPGRGFSLSVAGRTVMRVFPETAEQLAAAIRQNQSISIRYMDQSWSRNQGTIAECAQDMVDEPEARQAFINALDDPVYCSENFDEITYRKSPPIFTVRYVQPDSSQGNGEPAFATLTFSNRPSQNGELRGERLRSLLENESYASLSDMVRNQQGTPTDSKVIYAASFPRNNLKEIWEVLLQDRWANALSGIGLNSKTAIGDFIASQVAELQDQRIGRTTYGQVGKACNWKYWEKVRDEENKVNVVGNQPSVAPRGGSQTENGGVDHVGDDSGASALNDSTLVMLHGETVFGSGAGPHIVNLQPFGDEGGSNGGDAEITDVDSTSDDFSNHRAVEQGSDAEDEVDVVDNQPPVAPHGDETIPLGPNNPD